LSDPDSSDAKPSGRRLAVRLSLGIVALAFVSLMNRALGAAVEEFSRTGLVSTWAITLYVGFAVLGGFAFGLAAMLPGRIPAFHWGRASLLAILPAAIVAINVAAFTSPGLIPEWLAGLDFLFGLHVATVAAVLVGVAGSSAFAET
jgi:hypothetical protein